MFGKREVVSVVALTRGCPVHDGGTGTVCSCSILHVYAGACPHSAHVVLVNRGEEPESVFLSAAQDAVAEWRAETLVGEPVGHPVRLQE